jgi:hypothetical protein
MKAISPFFWATRTMDAQLGSNGDGVGDLRLHSACRPAYRPVSTCCENGRGLRGPGNVASLRLDCGSLGDGDLRQIYSA